MYEITNDNFKSALYHDCNIFSAEHIQDNGWISTRLYQTIWNMEDRGLFPVGYCKEVPFGNGRGVAFVFSDDENSLFWVHLPKILFKQWLRQLSCDFKNHPITKDL